MSLELVSVRYASLKGPEWVLVGVAIATVAVVVWEGWQASMGNDRPGLKVAAGIMLSFLGGVAVESGVEFFRSGMSTERWVIDVLAGLGSLLLSITYFTRRKGRTGPRSVIEWLNERNKTLPLFDKKDS
jgi:hypothetical protein